MPMPMMPVHQPEEDQGADNILLQEYEHFLSSKAEGTIDAYLRTVRRVMKWIAVRSGNEGRFHPSQLTKTAAEIYLAHLENEGYSINHSIRVKSSISSFASWLIEEKGLLQRNPTKGWNFPRSKCSLLASFQRISAISYALSSSKKEVGVALFSLRWATGQDVG
jgi:site-specific recombinase XerC